MLQVVEVVYRRRRRGKVGRKPKPRIVARVHHYATEAGRDPAGLPLEGRVRIAGKRPEEWVNLVQAGAGLGATYVIVAPRGGGWVFPHQHRAAPRLFREVVGSVLDVQTTQSYFLTAL